MALMSCTTVKDGLTMKKKSNSDEFLIEKKNPLIMPPSYGDLPKPEDSKKTSDAFKINDIEQILNKNRPKSKINQDSQSSVEKLILKKIDSE